MAKKGKQKKSRKKKVPKLRNFTAVAAFQRAGSGRHLSEKDKTKLKRRPKHRRVLIEEEE